MLKTYQFKTQCKGDIHSSKTANIILPGLVTEYTCSKSYWSSNAWSMDAGWNNSCHRVWILLRLFQLRYSDKTIFKMAAVCHLEFSKFGILVMW